MSAAACPVAYPHTESRLDELATRAAQGLPLFGHAAKPEPAPRRFRFRWRVGPTDRIRKCIGRAAPPTRLCQSPAGGRRVTLSRGGRCDRIGTSSTARAATW
jgi:hypothetical protein